MERNKKCFYATTLGISLASIIGFLGFHYRDTLIYLSQSISWQDFQSPQDNFSTNQISRRSYGALGDLDADGDVDLSDLELFTSCVETISSKPKNPCYLGDLDADGDVDLSDFYLFQRAYSGD